MVSLIPDDSLERLKDLFSSKFRRFSKLEVQALVTADLEGLVDNARIRQLTGGHTAEMTAVLQGLVRKAALIQEGYGRWTPYRMFLERLERKVDDGHGGKTRETRETLIFPRYHQLVAVRELVSAARRDGVGHNYLIQHFAGSGKTNSISWLSHRLASLHTEADQMVFDCVVVITDRQVLDRQLQDAIY